MARNESGGDNAEGSVRKSGSGEGLADNRRVEELFGKLQNEIQRMKELVGKKIDKLDK